MCAQEIRIRAFGLAAHCRPAHCRAPGHTRRLGSGHGEPASPVTPREERMPYVTLGAFRGQKGARSHGNAGIPGIAGNVVCVTYRI